MKFIVLTHVQGTKLMYNISDISYMEEVTFDNIPGVAVHRKQDSIYQVVKESLNEIKDRILLNSFEV